MIICGSTEIDGYAFCSGLTSLKLSYETCPKLQSLIPSVIYLIRGAIFRPKYVPGPGRVSLNICSLGELMDIYHAREATNLYDKIFALHNMSSDDDIASGLTPNYNIQWEQLFKRLVKFLLPGDVSVETCEDCQRAVIKSKGCILGLVSSVTSDDRQNVEIVSKNAAWSSREWSLQGSAKSVRKGDIVCLLKGASKPTIIRLRKDYFAIVMIAATPLNESQSFEQPEPKLITDFPNDLLLVWDWEDPLEGSQDHEEFETWTKNSQVQKHSKAELGDHLDKATRIWNVAVVLGDIEGFAEGEERQQEAIEIAFGKEHVYTLKVQHSLTPLSWAAGSGYDAVVAQLLAKDSAKLDSKDTQFGRTPLSWAAMYGHMGIVKLLLETGKVDVDSKDNQGHTPLSWASRRWGGHEAVVKLLLEKGADVHLRAEYRQTPLSLAAEQGHEAVAKLLLEKGADVDSNNINSQTPLSFAATNGHEAVVKLLLEKGANVDSKDTRWHKTPLMWAADYKHEAVVKLLKTFT